MIPFLYLSICLIWGSTWMAVKIGLDGVPPFLAAGLRFLLAAFIFFLIIVSRKKTLRLTQEDKLCIYSCGFLSFALSYACVYWSEQYISSGLTAILFSTMPLIVALLSHFWTGMEIMSPRKMTGIVVGIIGTIILFWPHENISLLKIGAMAVALLGSTASSVNLVMMKKYLRHTDIYVLNGLGMALGAACLLGLSLLTESYASISWKPENILATAYLALFGSVAAFLAYYSLIKMIDATLLSMTALIIPIVAVALGRAFLDEKITLSTGMGIFTVLLGVAIAGDLPRIKST